MKRWIILATLALAAGLPGLTWAASDACIVGAASGSAGGPTLISVTSTLSWTIEPSACAGGESFHSDAANCSGESGLVVSGAYCSATVAAGAQLRCMWALDVNIVETTVFAAWDTSNDGRISTENSEEVMGPLSAVPDPAAENPAPQYLFTNPGPGSARIIMFPTNLASDGPSALDRTLIGCRVP